MSTWGFVAPRDSYFCLPPSLGCEVLGAGKRITRLSVTLVPDVWLVLREMSDEWKRFLALSLTF